MSTISAASIQVAYDQKVIIDGLDCQLSEGKITTIIGRLETVTPLYPVGQFPAQDGIPRRPVS